MTFIWLEYQVKLYLLYHSRLKTNTTTKPLIQNKLGYARYETQSEIIEIIDLKYQKSM
jgi:hypothetical protein